MVDVPTAQAHIHRNSLSLLRVTRADALHPSLSPTHPSIYTSAQQAFQNLISTGLLIRAPTPTLYLYSQTSSSHIQHGIVATVRAIDYDRGTIRRHELTRRVKEDDRTKLASTLRAHVGPVFLTHRPHDDIKELITAVLHALPKPTLCVMSQEDGVEHALRTIPLDLVARLQKAFEKVNIAYIADGHHRAASAARVARAQRASIRQMNKDDDNNDDHDNHDGDKEEDQDDEHDVDGGNPGSRFPVVLFAASDLRVLAYNRVVTDLAGLTTTEFMTALQNAVGPLRPLRKTQGPQIAGEVHMYLRENGWYAITLPSVILKGEKDDGGRARHVDCARLQARVFAPLLDVKDPRESGRVEFVGGIHGTEELERRVRDGEAAVAFALCPVSVDELMEVADAGEMMPPKSTWFEPKLHSGFFIHTF